MNEIKTMPKLIFCNIFCSPAIFINIPTEPVEEFTNWPIIKTIKINLPFIKSSPKIPSIKSDRIIKITDNNRAE